MYKPQSYPPEHGSSHLLPGPILPTLLSPAVDLGERIPLCPLESVSPPQSWMRGANPLGSGDLGPQEKNWTSGQKNLALVATSFSHICESLQNLGKQVPRPHLKHKLTDCPPLSPQLQSRAQYLCSINTC